MSTLTQASAQWMSRPADQRFESLAAMHEAVKHHRDVAVEAPSCGLRDLAVVASDSPLAEKLLPSPHEDGSESLASDAVRAEPLLLSDTTNRLARFTNFSFGQLAREVGAPAKYLRTLPAALAAENLNHGIDGLDQDKRAKLLFAQNGDLVLRAMTGEDYVRIWNDDILTHVERLVEAQPMWQPAPAAFDGSRGLYASEKDIFGFMVDNDRRIFESLPGGGLGRGFFFWNSEVGDRSFGIMSFWYQYVCGNHMVWGAQNVKEVRIRHAGKLAEVNAFKELSVELRKYADASTTGDVAKVASMRTMTLGTTKDEVLDRVFRLGLPKAVAAQGYDKAVEHEDWYGNPHSVFGMVSGLTEVARDLPNADDRTELERKAGKVATIAF